MRHPRATRHPVRFRGDATCPLATISSPPPCPSPGRPPLPSSFSPTRHLAIALAARRRVGESAPCHGRGNSGGSPMTWQVGAQRVPLRGACVSAYAFRALISPLVLAGGRLLVTESGLCSLPGRSVAASMCDASAFYWCVAYLYASSHNNRVQGPCSACRRRVPRRQPRISCTHDYSQS